ncbi:MULTISPECIES: hypothetical protein [Pseudomonas]|uniref:Uncharacterized protein n=1 Tax=Pseudomonas protegens TaxID=380021 RepID=A0A9Q6IBY9_9PSED|nr:MULTISPECIES: hypothetical protein [Pseudomonas]MBS7562713.1 hypothetical protein [Pseudomonas sp. RC4D1]MCY7259864.1 hypothetical protein [Pseudomonas protegens]NMY71564.1 hypothetical protein [Pseudomonas sp. WS 5414]PYB97720.1 hypothetical protein DMX09_26500 [Pseudomonas protegens]PYC30773.1 hypothetical protein DMX08_26355 [Pseudomonas protegens]
MPAEVSQKNGLTLTILSCPSGRPRCVLVRLTGTALHAEIASEKTSAGDVQQPMDEFFRSLAQLEEGTAQDWLSEGQDLAFSASRDPLFPGLVFLRIYLGSTSDDDCDWQINGSLLLTPTQVALFAEKLKQI